MPYPCRDSDKPSIWRELMNVGLPLLALGAVALALLYAGAILYLVWPLGSPTIDKLGVFGDAFGALTSLLNALALAGVIATVVLQSRELRESRDEQKKMAKAQEAWAEAATAQMALTETIEATRLRPFVSCGWVETEDPNIAEFRLRNVGHGIAIVRSIELDKVIQERTSTLESHDGLMAQSTWAEGIKKALGIQSPGELPFVIRFGQFDDLNRVLGPGDNLMLCRVTFTHPEQRGSAYNLRRRFRALVTFEGIDGHKWTNEDQLRIYSGPQNADT